MDVRELAFLSLEKLYSAGRYSNIEVDTVIRRRELADEDRAFYTALVYGVAERRISLDCIINRFSRIPVEKLESGVLTVLRLGTYQIVFLDRVPDSAACNESVKLCKKHLHKGAEGYVNAVLRAVCRADRASLFPDKDRDPMLYRSVKYSVPVPVMESLSADYGTEKLERILETLSDPPYMTLRANTLKTSADELCETLRRSGVPAEKCSQSPYGVKLLGRAAIGGMLESMLEEGLFFVQDEASQLCVSELGLRPGDTFVDCCACPGGKSFSAAMIMENKGRIFSLDLHENKLSLVRKGAAKLGIEIIESMAADGRAGVPGLDGTADAVLCDVPCSGLGVMRKKPDIRYRFEEISDSLPELQYAVLCRGAEYLKAGGTLVYSTCTLRKKENEDISAKFAAEHPDFEMCGMRTIFPYEFGSDGFFTAKFIKKK